MDILDIFGKKDVGKELVRGVPYKIKTSFRPLRITARKNESVDLIVEVTNRTEEQLLTSVVVKVGKKLGFDNVGMNKVKEVRLGYLQGGETKELNVGVYGNSGTPPGTHKVLVKVFSHYRDYNHVLNSVKKMVELRAVE